MSSDSPARGAGWSAGVAVTATLVVISAMHLSAQGPCVELAPARIARLFDTPAFEASSSLLERLRSVTWSEMLRRSRMGETPSYDDSLGHALAARSVLGGNGAELAELPVVLTAIMANSGTSFSTGQAVVAADLYREWRLPPQAAELLIADPTIAPGSKVHALFALRDYASEAGFQNALASALCVLAAKADAVRPLLTGASRDSVTALLDRDELELLGQVEDALIRTCATGRATMSLDTILTPGSVVSKRLHSSLERVGCPKRH